MSGIVWLADFDGAGIHHNHHPTSDLLEFLDEVQERVVTHRALSDLAVEVDVLQRVLQDSVSNKQGFCGAAPFALDRLGLSLRSLLSHGIVIVDPTLQWQASWPFPGGSWPRS